MSGSKKVGLFLVLGWVYDADDPDVVVGIGHWGCDNPWLKKFFGVNLGASTVKEVEKKYPGGSFIADWPEAISLKNFEPCVVVERWNDPPSVGRTANDIDAYKIGAVCHRDIANWRQCVTELPVAWQIADVLALLPNDYGEVPAEYLAGHAAAHRPRAHRAGLPPRAVEEAFRLHGVTITVARWAARARPTAVLRQVCRGAVGRGGAAPSAGQLLGPYLHRNC